MKHWKRILFASAAGTSAILFLKGKKAAGFVAAGTGLAALATEYPEAFAEIRSGVPTLIRAGGIFKLATQLGRIAIQSRHEYTPPEKV
ncbi:MAG: hypothetical protein ABSE92_01190 [Terriglobales bacterium]|jgi:hypothetical protein